ncbi:MAG: SUF system NifU family Fe-S cluster assembly protein [Bacteroidota bacterium]
MSVLRELYQQIILDHNKSPKNFREMEDATRSVEAYNPFCGDHYTVYLKMDGGKIAETSFKGAGCAISKASASVMTSMVRGKSREEVLEMFEDFHRLVTGEMNGEARLETLGKLAVFGGVSEFPARVKCAILPWHALRSALTTEDPTITTE